jgi:hypothetical protein
MIEELGRYTGRIYHAVSRTSRKFNGVFRLDDYICDTQRERTTRGSMVMSCARKTGELRHILGRFESSMRIDEILHIEDRKIRLEDQ